MPKNSARHLHIKQHMTGILNFSMTAASSLHAGLIIHRPLTKIVGDIVFKLAG